MSRFFSSQQKHDKTNTLCTCDPWSLSYSHTITLDKGSYMSLASKRSWGDHTVRVEAIPSVGSSSCRPPGAVPTLLNFILSGQCLFKRPHSYSQELIVQEVKCWTWKRKDRPLAEILLTRWLSPISLMLREESDLKKKYMGVCTKKKTWIFIFHCQLQGKKNFFYNLHEGLKKNLYSWL